MKLLKMLSIAALMGSVAVSASAVALIQLDPGQGGVGQQTGVMGSPSSDTVNNRHSTVRGSQSSMQGGQGNSEPCAQSYPQAQSQGTMQQVGSRTTERH